MKLTPLRRSTYKTAQSTDPALAIYLLQQCVEKTVKAVALASGRYSPGEIKRRFKHASFRLLLDFFSKVLVKIQELNLTPYFTLLTGQDIQTAEGKLNDNIIFSTDWARCPSDRVIQWLTVVEKTRKEAILKTLRVIWGPHSKIKIKKNKVRYGNINEIVSSFSNIWTEAFGMPPLSDKELQIASLIPKLVVDSGLEVVDNTSETSIVLKRDTRSFLGMWSLAIGIVILACLTFPHESSTRYPPLEEARRSSIKPRELTCEDYNDSLGIVKHIGYLGYVTGLVLNDIEDMLGGIAGFFMAKLPISKNVPHDYLEKLN
jgi:hypothetical protein